MHHQHYTGYLQKELDFLKLLIARFHEQEKLSGLEVDIALAKAQDIYEQLLRLKLLPDSTQPGKPEKKTGKNEEPGSIVTEKKGSPVVVSSQEEILNVAIEQEPVPVKVEKKEEVVSVKKETEEKIQPATNEVHTQHTPEKKPVKKEGILAEKIRPTTYHPINETIVQNKSVADLSSRLQTTPLSSIVSGIGLNDRFLYIRELFQGNADMYNDTVRHLDAVASLHDALEFVDRHFDWNKEDETTQKFIHLVHRRHGTH